MRLSISALLLSCVLAACASPEGSASGSVTWAGTAAGEDILITLLGPATRATKTDAHGNWTLRQLPPGEYAIIAEAPDTLEHRVTATIEVTDNHRAEAEPLTLTRIGRIAGVVSPHQEGITVLVVGNAGAAQTSADGTFVIDAVPTGKRDLLVFAAGFAQQTVTGVEVLHAATTTLDPLTLVPVESGSTPLVGSLKGRAHVPGSTDDSAIRVEVVGTPLSTLTAADGSFTLDGVPNGLVAMAFTRGSFSTQLPRVLVVSGGNGFIIDGGLFDLGQLPISLRRGTRVLEGAATASAVAEGGAWAVLQVGQTQQWLVTLSGEVAVVSSGSVGSFVRYGFSRGVPAASYWFAALEPKSGEFVLQQTTLADRTTRSVSTLFDITRVRFAAGRDGAAWVNNGTLNLVASPTAAVTLLFPGKATTVVPLSDDAVLVAADSRIHEVKLDGTVVQSIFVPTGVVGLLSSPDGRWAVVGPVTANGTVSPDRVLVDRTTLSQRPLLDCTSGRFSPQSDLLLCEAKVLRLAVDGTVTTEVTPNHYNAAPFLGGGRMILIAPPRVTVVSPGKPDVTVNGASFESLAAFPTTDGAHVRTLANIDPLSGLGQVVDITLADGTVAVIAEGVATRPFLSNDRGVVVARPRSVGTDLDLFFVRVDGTEVLLGRSSRVLGGVGASVGSTFFSFRRLVAGRGYESAVLDTRDGSVVPLSMSTGSMLWLDDRHLLESVTVAAPFTAQTGVFRVELP